MSWEDREYARAGDYVAQRGAPYRTYGRPRSVVTTLIVINVVVYILCVMSSGHRGVVGYSPIFRWGAMVSELVLHGQIWRLVTSDYLHANNMHIFMNMLGLYFLGRPLEQLWGARKFFAVYTIAGVLGSAFYMILTLTGWLESGVAVGASGCVLGLLGAAAALFPHAEVYIYFLFPVKIRIVALVLGGYYVLNVFQGGNNAGGDACHLAGLAFGVWWAVRGDRWWAGYRRRGRITPTMPATGFRRRIAQRRADAELIDRILSKVHAAGVASLTEREKQALTEATARQQAEEKRYGRVDRL